MVQPPSSKTRHTFDQLQRQYIDSRINELLFDPLTSLTGEVDDQSIQILRQKSVIKVLEYKISLLEQLVESMKTNGSHSG